MKRTKNIFLAFTREGQSNRLEWSGILRYAANKANWKILSSPAQFRDSLRKIKKVHEENPIDGIIATDSTFNSLLADFHRKSGVKIVFLDSNPHDMADAATILDDAEVAKAAADLLLKRGYRHFAYVKGNPTYYGHNILHSDERAATFVRQIAKSGFKSTLIEDDENLTQSVKRLPKPVGVLAYNDYTANNVLDACHLMHIDIPGQLGLVGVDNDISVCENLRPMLTSIQPDFELAGYQAAQMLDRLISGKTVHNYHFGVRALIERDSTRDLRGSGRIVSAAQRIIRERFRENLTSDAIAAELHVSTRLLQMRFKQITEHSVHEELVRNRLNAAEQMLVTTSDTVRIIANSCGFQSIEHFHRLFRQRHGRSPQSWRKTGED